MHSGKARSLKGLQKEPLGIVVLSVKPSFIRISLIQDFLFGLSFKLRIKLLNPQDSQSPYELQFVL